jgi:hypothetical protein
MNPSIIKFFNFNLKKITSVFSEGNYKVKL